MEEYDIVELLFHEFKVMLSTFYIVNCKDV